VAEGCAGVEEEAAAVVICFGVDVDGVIVFGVDVDVTFFPRCDVVDAGLYPLFCVNE
jgi:hypothetical protein